MTKTIQALYADEPLEKESFDIKFPNQCPYCNTGIEAKHLKTYIAKYNNTPSLYSLFFVQSANIVLLLYTIVFILTQL